MVDAYCAGCFFRTHTNPMGHHCDYILITGHIRPCCSGEGCTVRMLGVRVGDGSVEARKEIYLKGRKKTEEEKQAARERRLAAKRAYNKEWYKKNREHNLERQKARRERIKAERLEKPKTECPEDWRTRKVMTRVKTKARWQGKQTEAIKSWKEAHGMTYGEMAEKIGVDSTTVMKWANEDNQANWEKLKLLGIEKPDLPPQIEKTA